MAQDLEGLVMAEDPLKEMMGKINKQRSDLSKQDKWSDLFSIEQSGGDERGFSHYKNLLTGETLKQQRT